MCSLRLDFLTFNIQAGNFAAATGDFATATAGTMDSLGACRDTFAVITNTNNVATPVICGQNEGQHSKLLTYVLNFYVPKSCFRISISNLNHFVSTIQVLELSIIT